MNELALFAGAGGGILGGVLLGWRTVCAVELDAYCASVLVARQNEGILPPFPIWDDVRAFDGRPWRGIVDVVSGGFPCQDISSSGKRMGLDGEHSWLWHEMFRVVCEVRPRYVLVENSAEIVGRGLGIVLGNLASCGFGVRWSCFPAAYCGAPQGRDRIWIAAYAHGVGCQASRKWYIEKQTAMRRAYIDGLVAAQHRARQAKTVFHGMDDAVAGRLDRIRATGNGQVPEMVKLAWEMLIDRGPGYSGGLSDDN